MSDNQYADALAATVRIKNITSSEPNRAFLHRIKNNDPSLNTLYIDAFDDEDYYVPREGDDLGWLGYFIGRNETLTTLYLNLSSLPGGREQVEKFFIGMQHNKSIKDVDIWGDDNLNEGFAEMNLPHVTTMTYNRPGERENAHYFALGLRQCKSLKTYRGPVTAEIVASLSMLPALESVDVWVNRDMAIRRVECVALRELLVNATQLKHLQLVGVGLGDDELEVLAEGLASNSSLANNRKLRDLHLCNNNIGDRVVQALASSLASNGTLQVLCLSNNNISDKGLEMLAAALIHNEALRELSIFGNTAITETGVRAISRTLQSHTSGLENLYLDGINIGTEGGKILADALSINKSLVSLSLLCVGGVSIGDDGLRALAAGLSSNSLCESYAFQETQQLLLQDCTLSSSTSDLRYVHWRPFQSSLSMLIRKVPTLLQMDWLATSL